MDFDDSTMTEDLCRAAKAHEIALGEEWLEICDAAVGVTWRSLWPVHATPVGSGFVARIQRNPIHEQAEVAVIARMQHATTAYDHLSRW
jgi:hypothetical protein